MVDGYLFPIHSVLCFVLRRILSIILDEIVALKRLKMEKEKEGFPITSLREINMLLKAGKHPNIVNVRVCFLDFHRFTK